MRRWIVGLLTVIFTLGVLGMAPALAQTLPAAPGLPQ